MATRDGVAFPLRCRIERLPEPVGEYQFALTQGRHWRFDWAWPRHRIALEVEGGVWIAGRHTSGAGFEADMEKYNAAQCLGWIVLRCLPRRLTDDSTFTFIRRAIDYRATYEGCR